MLNNVIKVLSKYLPALRLNTFQLPYLHIHQTISKSKKKEIKYVKQPIIIQRFFKVNYKAEIEIWGRFIWFTQYFNNFNNNLEKIL